MVHISLRRATDPICPRRAWPMAMAAALAALCCASCGNDTPAPLYDCCVTGVYYVCATKVAFGQCVSIPSDPSGCVFQANAECPPGTGQ